MKRFWLWLQLAILFCLITFTFLAGVYLVHNRIQVTRAMAWALNINSTPVIWSFISMLVLLAVFMTAILSRFFWSYRYSIELQKFGEVITAGRMKELERRCEQLSDDLRKQEGISAARRVQVKSLYSMMYTRTDRMRQDALEIVPREDL